MNGVTIVDYEGKGVLDDEAHKSHNVGMKEHICLQIHPGGPTKLRFKDIMLKQLLCVALAPYSKGRILRMPTNVFFHLRTRSPAKQEKRILQPLTNQIICGTLCRTCFSRECGRACIAISTSISAHVVELLRQHRQELLPARIVKMSVGCQEGHPVVRVLTQYIGPASGSFNNQRSRCHIPRVDS